ncbi:MAG: MBL fold metallo-hydrolase [Patescibacteria group bacterium]
MIITYYGAASVKVQIGDTVLAFNPVSKESKQKASRFGANIALISVNHPDYNGSENAAFGDKQPFVVDGPGEYESSGIFIKGIKTDGPNGLINTAYSVLFENIRMVHLGGIGSKEIAAEAKEAMGSIDIVFVPLSGEGILPADEAYDLASSFEPAFIIPLHGGEKGKGTPLDKFLEEAGEDAPEFLDKLTVKKKDLEGKESEIVFLSSVL